MNTLPTTHAKDEIYNRKISIDKLDKNEIV